jgi:hypothetical protein
MFFLLTYSIILPQILAFILYKNNIDVSGEQVQNALMLVQDILLFAIPIAIALIVTSIPIKECFPHSRLSLKNILYIIFLTFTFMPLMLFIGVVASTFFSTDVSTTTLDFVDNMPLIPALIATALMPAIFEELTFRGVILSGYKSMGFTTAVVMSGLFFGIMHLNLYQFFYAMIGGMYLAFLVYYTNSIYSSILAHFIINGWQTVLAKLVMSTQTSTAVQEVATTEATAMQQIVITCFYAAVTVIAMPVFIFLVKKFAARNSDKAKEYRLSCISENTKFKNAVPRCIDMWLVLTIIVAILMFIYSEIGIVG